MNEDDPVITLENIHYYEKQRTNHFILIQQLNILLEQTILNERKEYGKIFHNKINIPLYINICEAMILALDEQETVDGDDDNNDNNNIVSSTNYKILNKSMKEFMSLISIMHHQQQQQYDIKLIYRILSMFQQMLTYEHDKLLIDFGNLVIKHSVTMLHLFTNNITEKKNKDNDDEIESIIRVCIENIELFSNERNIIIYNFELIDNKVIQSLLNTIAYLLKSDHINSNSLLVRGIDIVANMLLNQDLSNHINTRINIIDSLFSMIDRIYLLYICGIIQSDNNTGNNDNKKNHPRFFMKNIKNHINVINKMKKKHMMMNHLLEENNVYKTQAPLPREEDAQGNIPSSSPSSTNIININNITLESIVVKDDEQHVIMIVFDSIVNLMRNLISICNDSKKLNILKSSIFIKSLLELDYIHDYNINSIFHNMTSRAPNVCKYIIKNTNLLKLFSDSIDLLINDETFYNTNDLLHMQYFTICTLHNILLSRLNNINTLLLNSDLVIDSSRDTPTLNNAINLIAVVRNNNANNNGAEDNNNNNNNTDSTSNNNNDDIKKSDEVDETETTTTNNIITTTRISIKNEPLSSFQLKQMWTIISYGMKMINYNELSSSTNNIENILLLDVLDVSTSAIRMLYDEIKIEKNDNNNNNNFHILYFENDLLDICKLALVIMKNIFPIVVSKIDGKREDDNNVKLISDIFNNCVFILKFILDIMMDDDKEKVITEHDIENDSLNMSRQNSSTSITNVDTLIQEIYTFISTNILLQSNNNNNNMTKLKLMHFQWIGKGIVQELELILENTSAMGKKQNQVDKTGSRSSRRRRSSVGSVGGKKKCIVM